MQIDAFTVACVCVCPLFTLRVLFGAVLMHMIASESFYTGPLQIWQEPGTKQWPLIREEVCLSLSSKTPRVDQSDEWLIPPCCFLSLFLSASGLHECVDCHHITLTLLMPTKPPVLQTIYSHFRPSVTILLSNSADERSNEFFHKQDIMHLKLLIHYRVVLHCTS